MRAIFVAVLLLFGLLWFWRRKKRNKGLALQSSTSSEILSNPDDIILIYQDCSEIKACVEYISKGLQEDELSSSSKRLCELWTWIWAQVENVPPRFLPRIHGSIEMYQLILLDFIGAIESNNMTPNLKDDFNQRIDAFAEAFKTKLPSISMEVKSESGYIVHQASLFQDARNLIISGGTFIQNASYHDTLLWEQSATSLQLQYRQLRLQYVQLGFLFA